MRLYEYSDLEPGMTLAVPLYGKDRLLLAAEVMLTPALIRRLPGWGIYQVLVQTEEEHVSQAA